MSSNRKIEKVLILKSKFDLEDRRVWFGKARLLADRIILKGLGYSKSILLTSIKEVRWSSDLLVVECEDGDHVEMIIQSAALWKYELQARCSLKDAYPGLDKMSDSPVPHIEEPLLTGSETRDHESIPEPDPVVEEDSVPDVEPIPEMDARDPNYRIRQAYAQDRPRLDSH